MDELNIKEQQLQSSPSASAGLSKDKYVRIKQKHICVLLNSLDKISVLFSVKLVHVGGYVNKENGQQFVKFKVVPENCEVPFDSHHVQVSSLNITNVVLTTYIYINGIYYFYFN